MQSVDIKSKYPAEPLEHPQATNTLKKVNSVVGPCKLSLIDC